MLIPTKYIPSLPNEHNVWSEIKSSWSNQSLEIRAIQGFFFGGSFQFSSDSEFFSETKIRLREANFVRRELSAEFLIVGAPAARKFKSYIHASRGLATMLRSLGEDERLCLIENLPVSAESSFLSSSIDLAKWLPSESSAGMCLDIGNHFSWHESKSQAFKELEKVASLGIVRDIQFNILEPQKFSWFLELLSSGMFDTLPLSNITIEPPPDNFDAAIFLIDRLSKL